MYTWSPAGAAWDCRLEPSQTVAETEAAVEGALACVRVVGDGTAPPLAYRTPAVPLDLAPGDEDRARLGEGGQFVPVRKPGVVALLAVARAVGADAGAGFVMFRSSFRVLAEAAISGSRGGALDLQLHGGVIFARRRLHYDQHDMLSTGAMFERACVGGAGGDSDGDVSLRTVARVAVGGHEVVLSAETDATDGGGRTVELKTTQQYAWRAHKRKHAWVQCHFCGTDRVVVGLLDRTRLVRVETEEVPALVSAQFRRDTTAAVRRALDAIRATVTRERTVFCAEVVGTMTAGRELVISEVEGGYERRPIITDAAAECARL